MILVILQKFGRICFATAKLFGLVQTATQHAFANKSKQKFNKIVGTER